MTKKNRFGSDISRLAVLPVVAALLLSAACAKGGNTEPVITEKPTIEPEISTPAPLSLEEAYDVEFDLPVTGRGMDTVDPQSYAAVDGLGRTLSGTGDSYTSSLLSGTVKDRDDSKFVGIF